MPRALIQQDTVRLRKAVYEMCELRGYTQTIAAEQLGITQPRVSQLLAISLLEFKERAKAHLANPQESRLKKLEQFQLLRQEAFLAWERSKTDAERTTEEKQLKTVFITATDEAGEEKKIPAGQRLQIVKAVRMIEGRLPANEYLSTIVKCLTEEARLEGLIEDTILKVTNNNSASAGVSVSWEPLINVDRAAQVPDVVEMALAAASAPAVTLSMEPQPPAGPFTQLDVGKTLTIKEQPVGEWSEAEARELDDEHLNGDGA